MEYIAEHICLRNILIGLVVISLTSKLGAGVLVICGGILLIKPVIYGLAYIPYIIDRIIPGGDPQPDPMAYAPHRRTEEDNDDEILDFDTYEDMFGNKYRYDRSNGELIDRNHQRIKVSQVYEHDLKLEDSKGYPYDRIN